MIQNQNRQKIDFEIFKDIGPKSVFPIHVLCFCMSILERLRLSYRKAKRKIRDGIDFKISVFFLILLYLMSLDFKSSQSYLN
jgi:hypothetical protein